VEICCAFIVLAFVSLTLKAKPGAFRKEVLAIVVERALDGYALIFSADMWRYSIPTVCIACTIDRFAFVVFANFLIVTVFDAFALRYITRVCFNVFIDWIVA